MSFGGTAPGLAAPGHGSTWSRLAGSASLARCSANSKASGWGSHGRISGHGARQFLETSAAADLDAASRSQIWSRRLRSASPALARTIVDNAFFGLAPLSEIKLIKKERKKEEASSLRVVLAGFLHVNHC